MLLDVDPLTLFDSGFPGWMTLLFAATATLAALLALVAMWREKKNTQWRAAHLFLTVGALQSLAIAFVAAHDVVRKTMHIVANPRVHESGVNRFSFAVTRMESGYLVFGLALFFTTLLVGFVVVRVAFRASRSPSSWFVPLVGVLLMLVTATGILLRAEAAMYPYRGAALAVYELIWLDKKTAEILPPTRMVVLGLASVASVLVVGWCAVRRKQPLFAPLISINKISLGVAISGVALWGFTRPLAEDAQNPIPFPEDAFAGYDCPANVASSPMQWPKIDGHHDQCAWDHLRRYEPSTILDLGSGGPVIGGLPIKDPAAARAYVQKQIMSNRDPSHGLLPDLLIAAPASKPPEEWGAWLAAIGKPWRGRPAAIPSSSLRIVMVHNQPVIHSATVGDIERNPRCSCPPIGLSSSGADISAYDWGRLAQTAASTSIEQPLVVNPGWDKRDDEQAMEPSLEVEEK